MILKLVERFKLFYNEKTLLTIKLMVRRVCWLYYTRRTALKTEVQCLPVLLPFPAPDTNCCQQSVALTSVDEV